MSCRLMGSLRGTKQSNQKQHNRHIYKCKSRFPFQSVIASEASLRGTKQSLVRNDRISTAIGAKKIIVLNIYKGLGRKKMEKCQQ